MNEQEQQQGQQWEYCVLSTVSWVKPASAYDAIQTELRYQDEAYTTVKVTSIDNRRRVILNLGRGGWELVNAVHETLFGPSGATANEEVFYFKRPVKDDRKITDPKIEG